MAASKKITELTELTSPLADDLYATVDSATTTTKKIKYSSLGISQILFKKVSLSAAQILTLNTVPVIGVAGPGAGKVIKAIGAFVRYTFGTAAYTVDVGMQLITDAAINAQLINTNVIDGVATKISDLKPDTTQGILVTNHVANKALLIQVPTANPTALPGAAGTADVYIFYSITNL